MKRYARALGLHHLNDRKIRVNVIPPETREAVAAALDGSRSAEAIGEEFGISDHTVRRIAREFNRPLMVVPRYGDFQRRAIAFHAARARGQTYTQIARSSGLAWTSVRYILNNFDATGHRIGVEEPSHGSKKL